MRLILNWFLKLHPLIQALMMLCMIGVTILVLLNSASWPFVASIIGSGAFLSNRGKGGPTTN